jgi:hypothetical protein
MTVIEIHGFEFGGSRAVFQESRRIKIEDAITKVARRLELCDDTRIEVCSSRVRKIDGTDSPYLKIVSTDRVDADRFRCALERELPGIPVL